MLHGGTQDGDDFAVGTRMNERAEEHGLIVAYPSQSKAANASLCWNWFMPEHQKRGAGEPADHCRHHDARSSPITLSIRTACSSRGYPPEAPWRR